MIELYYWLTPNGHKITMFLEEVGLAYRFHPVDISAGDQFKPEFPVFSPNNRMPAIIDTSPPDGGEPITAFESGAILQYLTDKTGRFLSTDLGARKTVMEWVFWQVGGLGPMAGQNHHFGISAPEKIQYAIDRYVKKIIGLENELGAGFFERTQRGSTITPAWRALLGDARRILATYDLARKNVRETSATFQHRLCIGLSGMTVGLAHPKLTRLLACHRRQSITVDLSITEYQYDAMLRDVRDGLVDVGITLGGVHADDLVVSRLWDDPILAVVAADHALAGRESPGPPALGPIISLGYASVRKCLAMGSPRPCRQYCGCAKLLLYRRGCSTASSSARGRSGPRSST